MVLKIKFGEFAKIGFWVKISIFSKISLKAGDLNRNKKNGSKSVNRKWRLKRFKMTKMVENDPKCCKMTRKWPKMTKKDPKMTEIDQTRPKMTGNDRKWLKYNHKSPKMTNSPKIAQERQKMGNFNNWKRCQVFRSDFFSNAPHLIALKF